MSINLDFVKIISQLWLLLMLLICYSLDHNETVVGIYLDLQSRGL